MDFEIIREPEPRSAQEDFYVESDCCLFCGVPQAIAPNLVGWIENERYLRCYWKKQPKTPEEMQQAFAIFDGQDVGCHRYAGHNPEIQARIGFENCDFPANRLPESPMAGEPPKFWIAPTFFEQLWAKLRRRG